MALKTNGNPSPSFSLQPSRGWLKKRTRKADCKSALRPAASSPQPSSIGGEGDDSTRFDTSRAPDLPTRVRRPISLRESSREGRVGEGSFLLRSARPSHRPVIIPSCVT